MFLHNHSKLLDELLEAVHNGPMTMTVHRIPQTGAEKAIADELAQVDRELEKLPLYKRRVALSAALESLTKVDFKSPDGGIPRALMSYAAIAEAVIRKMKRPASTREIVNFAPDYGRSIGGSQPLTNLSNTLSSYPDFMSVEWNGGKGWWMKSLGPVPKE